MYDLYMVPIFPPRFKLGHVMICATTSVDHRVIRIHCKRKMDLFENTSTNDFRTETRS